MLLGQIQHSGLNNVFRISNQGYFHQILTNHTKYLSTSCLNAYNYTESFGNQTNIITNP